MKSPYDAATGRSVSQYLGVTMHEVGEVREGTAVIEGTAPIPRYLRTESGAVAMGALLGLSDSVAGLCSGLASLPGWIVSTNLMLRAVHLEVAGPLALRAEVLRVGRNAVVASIAMTDAGDGGRVVADGALTSSILQPEGGPPVHDRPVRLEPRPLDPDTTPALPEFLGVEIVDSNTLALPIAQHLRNPWGILHGGVTAALVDLAARHTTGGTVTTDTVLHFVAPGRVGPVTIAARPIGDRPDGTLVRLEIRDSGADDRLMAFAFATARA